MNTTRAWLTALLLSMTFHIPHAAAVATTPQEYRAMEPACKAIGMGEVDGVFWAEALNRPQNRHILLRPENAMAVGNVAFHHYCWGKLAKFRYFAARSATQREFQIRRWRGEMEYVTNNTDPRTSWPYLHVIHKEIAETYFYEKNYIRAIAEAERAIKLNNESARAYMLIADAYSAIKNKPKALEYVTEGLSRIPGSNSLKRRYRELGGKMPYPQPIPKAQPEQASPTPPATPPAVASDLPANDPPTQMQKGSDEPAAGSTEKPPGNPYCRFCP